MAESQFDWSWTALRSAFCSDGPSVLKTEVSLIAWLALPLTRQRGMCNVWRVFGDNP